MSHALLPRTAWTSVPRPIDQLTPLVAAEVRGIAVHWPGSTGTWGPAPTLAQSAARLQAERAQHTSPSSSDPTKPWSDIAYSLAVDLAGRLFDARGIAYRPAANGDQHVNRQYVAVTVLALTGDAITSQAIAGVRAARALVLDRYPHATAVVGHRDLHPTDCPGDALYGLVHSGAFATQQEDDMPLSDEDLTALRGIVREEVRAAVAGVPAAVWTAGWPAGTPDDPERIERAQDRLVWAARGAGLTGTLDTIMGMLRSGVPIDLTSATVEALAVSIAGHLPPGGADPTAIARAVRAEFAAHPLT